MPLLYPAVFVFGGVCYLSIELLWRKRTHWSMGILGGAAFLLLFVVFARIGPEQMLLKGLIGTVLITCLEFLGGAVVNVGLKWNVWDYSALPLNLYGQVCLLFSGFWFLLSMLAALIVQAIVQFSGYSGL
ncbi:MAG TPA: hypothetical protein VN366_08330 [Feifaniaceae bacterium]|nr:hypothetical protein [Feifaniaceae bacterium]